MLLLAVKQSPMIGSGIARAVLAIAIALAPYGLVAAETGIGGVGLLLGWRTTGGCPRIAGVALHSPASLAGLSSGWSVVAVEGVRTQGKPIEDCVQLFRGKIGSKVTLELIDQTGSSTNRVTLPRVLIFAPDRGR